MKTHILSLSVALALAAPMVSAKDGALNNMVANAVVQQPEVQAKRAAVREAEANHSAARSGYMPRPSAQWSRDQQGHGVMTLTVSQPLWAGGAIDAAVDSASASINVALAALAETEITTAIQLTEGLRSFAASCARQDAYRTALGRLERLNQTMQRRALQGVSAPVDQQLGQARIAQLRSEQMAEEAASGTLQITLARMLGVPQFVCQTMPSDAALGSVLREESELVDRAGRAHPAVRRANAEVEVAQFQGKRIKAELQPTVSLQVQHSRNRNPLVGNSTGVYLVVEFQPGAGLGKLHGISAAAERVAQADAAVLAARRTVEDRLRAEFVRTRAAQGRLVELQRTVKTNEEVLAASERLFNIGKRTWIDVVNAARELAQAELAVADSMAIVGFAALNLHFYAGEVAGGSD